LLYEALTCEKTSFNINLYPCWCLFWVFLNEYTLLVVDTSSRRQKSGKALQFFLRGVGGYTHASLDNACWSGNLQIQKNNSQLRNMGIRTGLIIGEGVFVFLKSVREVQKIFRIKNSLFSYLFGWTLKVRFSNVRFGFL